VTGRHEDQPSRPEAAWQQPVPSGPDEQRTEQYSRDSLAEFAAQQHRDGMAEPAAAPPPTGDQGADGYQVPEGAAAPPASGAHEAPEPHSPPNYEVPANLDPGYAPDPAAGPVYAADPTGGVQPSPYADPNASPELTQQIAFPAQHAVQPQPQPGYPPVPGPSSQPFPAPQQFPTEAGGYYTDPAAAPPQPQQPYFPPAGPPQPVPSAPGNRLPVPVAGPQDLSSAHLIKQTKRPPRSGWRKAVYQVSGHVVNLGESAADIQHRELIARINQPLRGCYKIAMLSLKGGVGKTTMTTTLGSTFASLRGDRVIAVDANPDRGTLSQKIPLETTATVRHLLRDASRITRYSDVRAYTSQGPSRLEVLASEQDPAVSEAFSEDDYRRTIDLLEHFYNIVITDCGTGLMHSAMKGVLDIADSLVLVSSGSVDGARSASATLDWLDMHGYHDLVARSVAVINSVRPSSGKVDLDKLAEHFGARCRAVCRIPFDPHLEEGAEIELDQLSDDTRLAMLKLGSIVADDFPNDLTRR
jgi:MinD-like ATPase involved in chromosome partitioning or flagellar assembly